MCVCVCVAMTLIFILKPTELFLYNVYEINMKESIN